jgi:endonuclease YncB( thermonuclease family)
MFLVTFGLMATTALPTASASDDAAQSMKVIQPPRLDTPDFTDLEAVPVDSVRGDDVVVLELGRLRVPVRLLGVAPVDANHPRRDQARAMLENLLKGESVYAFQLSNGQMPDATDDGPAPQPWAPSAERSRGSRLAEVYLFRAPDGLFINLEMVRQGYARARQDARAPYAPVFAFYQAAAEQHERGLWSPESHKPRTQVTGQASPEAPEVSRDPNASASVTVHVTAHGTRYHRKGCSYLSDSAMSIALAEAHQRGLKPCTRCRPPENTQGKDESRQ